MRIKRANDNTVFLFLLTFRHVNATVNCTAQNDNSIQKSTTIITKAIFPLKIDNIFIYIKISRRFYRINGINKHENVYIILLNNSKTRTKL